VVNYFFFIAEEVRQIMAQLGIRKFDDLIGRSDLLDMRKGIEHWKASGLDFGRLFAQPQAPVDVPRFQTLTQDHGLEKALDNVLIAKSRSAIDKGERVQFMEVARNVNRSVGAMLSGAVTKVHPEGLPDDSIRIQLEGTGGQSFGAFLTNGITLYLIGDANDYTGKGLSGGRVVVRPSIDFRGAAVNNTIVGNTVMYGATAGEAFFSGVGGERFAVRLSGATAVVEGTGDHGCEYMTGGRAVVLGETGRNFAAGMSGGIAYVWDASGSFKQKVNKEMVEFEELDQSDLDYVKARIEKHVAYTDSARGKAILAAWPSEQKRFVKVMPTDYKRAVAELRKLAEQEQEEAKKGGSHLFAAKR
jgi:glutamate synthase (NADPH/NADH) large chain/glutamate synthase (ferredoxin)